MIRQHIMGGFKSWTSSRLCTASLMHWVDNGLENSSISSSPSHNIGKHYFIHSTHTRTHTHTPAHTPTHIVTRTSLSSPHTYAHPHTHTHTHTHTHIISPLMKDENLALCFP